MSDVLKDLAERCGNCKFLRVTEYDRDGNDWAGECRRYAPRASSSAEWAFWPKASIRDWCGEWQDGQDWQ